MKQIYKKLLTIQSTLKAQKNQYNSFGKYHYRNCEDILEGVKPLLLENECVLIMSDEIIQVGDRYYSKATVTLLDVETEESVVNTSEAREEESKKGMDGSQVTGASGSYARKYALNGLFAIDDSKDSDTTNSGDKEDLKSNKPPNNKPSTEPEGETQYSCYYCKTSLTEKIYNYSVGKFKVGLCMKCQKLAQEKIAQKKAAQEKLGA